MSLLCDFTLEVSLLEGPTTGFSRPAATLAPARFGAFTGLAREVESRRLRLLFFSQLAFCLDFDLRDFRGSKASENTQSKGCSAKRFRRVSQERYICVCKRVNMQLLL